MLVLMTTDAVGGVWNYCIRPAGHRQKRIDLAWIGNWGDEERTEELIEFLVEPVRRLGLTAEVYGVRYPDSARRRLEEAGITFKGWLPNFRVPEVLAQARLTIHVPRRPYASRLPGIPTIRPFEALACGIPLVCAPWSDCEGLFRPGEDYLIASDSGQMRRHLERILTHADTARSLAGHGLERIRARHTCAHRVDELPAIWRRVSEKPLPGGIGLGSPTHNSALGGLFQPMNHRQDADATRRHGQDTRAISRKPSQETGRRSFVCGGRDL